MRLGLVVLIFSRLQEFVVQLHKLLTIVRQTFVLFSGCGGSTLYVLQELDRLYGSKLKSYRVLLLNAGGQSQRLPSASVLGKVFTALPVGKPMYQLLEVKLAIYLPLLIRMKPGIFHASSDTIEAYDLGDGGDWTFEKAGFTAMAHPSSVEIGTTHGVFVLEENDSATTALAALRRCLRVLQKPSVQTMKDQGAIMTINGRQAVYTDSCFFFDHDVADKLLEFYRLNAPLDCEIDAYGDFLQALGPQATIDYTTDTKNVSQIEPKLAQVRQQIYHLLRDTPLNIVLLSASQFYHLGTMSEYIDHLCVDTVLARHVGFGRYIFNHLLKSDPPADGFVDAIQGCLMHNRLPRSSTISHTAVVEYCDFDDAVDIGSRCVISNCASLKAVDVVIPDDKFLHTVAVRREGGDSEYVTMVLDIGDNLKTKAKSESGVGTLTFLGQPLSVAMEKLSLSVGDLFPNCPPPYSLWYAQLFPVCSSMSESFNQALGLLQTLSPSDTVVNGDVADSEPVTRSNGNTTDRMSMADMLQYKDVAAMLAYRRQLHDKIKSSQ